MRKKPPIYRQILALTLAAVMALSLTACNKKQEPEPAPPPIIGESTQTEDSGTPLPDFSNNLRNAKTQNEDTVGWLYIPDTTINNSVLQTTNNTYYHRLNEDKTYSWTGCFYADYEGNLSSRGELSKNNIIYGHNVHYDDNKEMERFSQLFKFTDIDFAKEHPYVYFSLHGKDPTFEENSMAWEIFSIFYTTTDFNYIQVMEDNTGKGKDELTEAQFMGIVKEAKARSEYVYDVDVLPTDHILSLSTCSYKYGRRDDVRFVVMAKLLDNDVKRNESVDIKVNKNKKEVE